MNIFKILYYLLKHGKMPDTSKWEIKEGTKNRWVLTYDFDTNANTKTTTHASALEVVGSDKADQAVTYLGTPWGKVPKA